MAPQRWHRKVGRPARRAGGRTREALRAGVPLVAAVGLLGATVVLLGARLPLIALATAVGCLLVVSAWLKDRRPRVSGGKGTDELSKGGSKPTLAAVASEPSRRPARTGVRLGRIEMTRALNALRADEFLVLHNRQVPESSELIEHIAVGPSGVWVVSFTSWRGAVRLADDGQRLRHGHHNADTDLLRARSRAAHVSRTLAAQPLLSAKQAWATPVLAVHGPEMEAERLVV